MVTRVKVTITKLKIEFYYFYRMRERYLLYSHVICYPGLCTGFRYHAFTDIMTYLRMMHPRGTTCIGKTSITSPGFKPFPAMHVLRQQQNT